MKKRILALVLALAMAFSLLVFPASAAEDELDSGEYNGFTWLLTRDGTVTIHGTGTINSDLKSCWSEWGSMVKAIVIEPGVTTIGRGAFSGCYSLTSVTLPDSVTEIGKSAFSGCSNLSSVEIGSNVNSILEDAFRNCTSLTSVTLPNSLTLLDDAVFMGCSNLSGIEIPDGVTVIHEQTFQNCTSLASVTIPDSVTRIDHSAFFDCTSLTSVTLPEGIPTIPYNLFYNCISLTEITVPESVTSIGNTAFFACQSLNQLAIPAGVTSIGTDVFSGCSSLEEINVAEGNTKYQSNQGVLLNKVGTRLICCPAGKTGVYEIPDSVILVSDSAFRNCAVLTDVTMPEGVATIGNNAFYNCSSLASLTIPDSVTSIGEAAFQNCSNLACVTIPAGITEIKNAAFDNCGSLLDVYYGGTQEQWKGLSIAESNYSLDNATIHFSDGTESLPFRYSINEDACTVTITGYKNVNGKAINIPESIDGYPVASIGDYAFRGAGLASVTIPDSVTSMGKGAFYYCDSMTEAAIGSGITTISYDAFSECHSLTQVTIPASVNYIADFAFNSCPLTDVYYGGTREQWNSIRIINKANDALYDATIHFADGTTSNDPEPTATPPAPTPTPTPVPTVEPTSTPVPTPAPTSGVCGVGLNWELSEDGVLTISGEGEMWNFLPADPNDPDAPGWGEELEPAFPEDAVLAPWYSQRDRVMVVVIESGVTSIGNWAFFDHSSLSDIYIPVSVTHFGYYPFASYGNYWGYLNDLFYDGTYEQLTQIDTAIIEDIGWPVNSEPRIHTQPDETPEPTVEPTPSPDCDHSYEIIEQKDPTCTESGHTLRVCSICGNKIYETTPALGHHYNERGSDATCTRDGNKAYICSRCDHWYSETIEAKGHSWSSWNVESPAAENTDGQRSRSCTVCGEIETQLIHKLSSPDNHVYTTKVLEPTCSEDGYTARVCACGDTIIVDGTYTKALGHDWDDGVVILKPTDTQNGLIHYICQRCGEDKFEEIPNNPEPTPYPTAEPTPYPTAEPTPYPTPIITPAPLMPLDTYTTVSNTRANFIWLLWRIADAPMPSQNDCPFPDMPVDYEHYNAIMWAYENNLIHGFEDGTFRPDNSLTRAEAATLLHRFVDFLNGGNGYGSSGTSPFEDVSENAWYFNDVLWFTCDPEHFGDYTTTRFYPDEYFETFSYDFDAQKYILSLPHTEPLEPPLVELTTIGNTRAELVWLLWRIAGAPDYSNASVPFYDVPTDAYYYSAVAWAYNCGVMNGLSQYEFVPEQSCTRAQVATMLYRMNGMPMISNPIHAFEDVYEGNWYYDAICWFADQPNYGEYGDKYFYPNDAPDTISYDPNTGAWILSIPSPFSYYIADGEAIIVGYSENEEVGTDLVIPETLGGCPVTTIRPYSFSDHNLTSIFIPATVTNIGPSVFAYTYDLTDIQVSEDNPVYASKDGCLVSKDGTQLLAVPGSLTGSYTTPEGVTELGLNCFEGTRITEVTLPEGVTVIGVNAFSNCRMEELNLPSTLTEIGDYAISGCPLQTVVYNGGYREWGQVKIGSENFSLQNAQLICLDRDENVPGELSYEIVDDEVYITGLNRDYLGALVIPDTIEGCPVAGIRQYAFSNCHYLTNVTLPDSIRVIEDHAFYDCGSLSVITIPASMTLIAQSTFEDCVTLTEVTIPQSVTFIDVQAFDGTRVKTVNYGGTASMWDDVIIKNGNERLYRAEVICMTLAITAQPEDYTGLVNSSASFRVAAEGEGLTYQWQYSDNGGETWKASSVKSAVYTTKLTAARDGRMVRCIVTDVNGNSVTSAPAVMRLAPVMITGQPESYAGSAGDSVPFRVTAAGEGLTYQWQYSDDGGETWKASSVKTAVYTTKLTAGRDGRMIRCVVTDQNGNSVTSEPAVMRLLRVTITGQPQDQTAPVNKAVTFRVTAEGDGLTYQWQYSDDGVTWKNSSVTGAKYSTKVTAARDGRQVRCIVTEWNGDRVISDVAAMRIG